MHQESSPVYQWWCWLCFGVPIVSHDQPIFYLMCTGYSDVTHLEHLFRRIRFLPTSLSVSESQISYIKGSKVLSIRASRDVIVALITHQIAHLSWNLLEVRNIAIMHDGVSAKDEWMVVCRGNSCGGSGTDMRENDLGCSVCTYRAEVPVVQRWLNALIKCWMSALRWGSGVWKESLCGRVPCHSKAINVEETVPLCDLGLGGWFCMNLRIVGEELWKVMLVDLLGESMLWGFKELQYCWPGHLKW